MNDKERAICKQIKNIRDLSEQARLDRIAFAEAENQLKHDKAFASMEIALGIAKTDKGQMMPSNNDIARKAYIEWKTVAAEKVRNIAKENRDSSAEKLDIEKSVLSALKELLKDENFDINVLGEYEI